MKFKVSANLHKNPESPPCDRATLETISDTIGGIKISETRWVVNLDTLEDIVRFCKENSGTICLTTDGEVPEISVYADWTVDMEVKS